MSKCEQMELFNIIDPDLPTYDMLASCGSDALKQGGKPVAIISRDRLNSWVSVISSAISSAGNEQHKGYLTKKYRFLVEEVAREMNGFSMQAREKKKCEEPVALQTPSVDGTSRSVWEQFNKMIDHEIGKLSAIKEIINQ